MEFIVIPNDVSKLSTYYANGAHTFILGLENYCINYPSVSLDKIKELSKRYPLFIGINKNIFNSEIDDLKEKLIELSKLPILGVLFYDLGILNLVKENHIPLELVWHQTHMVTNYNTCNFYYDKGVKYGFLANEITLDEILDIRKKTKMKLMVEAFGYPIMSHSRRRLLSNYFKAIGKEQETRTYELKEKENRYLLKETRDGASILYGKLINGTRPLFELIDSSLDYGILDMQEVPQELGEKVLDKYLYILNHKNMIHDKEKEAIIQIMNEMIGDNTNFFYKKTIYKVKKGENHEK